MLVRTTESQAAAVARIAAGLAVQERHRLVGLLRCCFARTGTWLHAGKYVDALASELSSRNGWSIAEQAGDRAPDRTQRLLGRASWDEGAAMGLVAQARRGRTGPGGAPVPPQAAGRGGVG